MSRLRTARVPWRRPPPNPFERNDKIHEFLRQPTWSVRSLLPVATSNIQPTPSASASEEPTTTTTTTTTADTDPSTPKITRKDLHHLLRLSALPHPRNPQEETSLINSLQTQLHFVRAIQAVDTTDVEPLISIRDETEEARVENTFGLEALRGDLEKEVVVGRLGRIKRRKVGGRERGKLKVEAERGDARILDAETQGQTREVIKTDEQRTEEAENWDLQRMAAGKMRGRYFMVKRGRPGQGQGQEAEAGPGKQVPRKDPAD